MIGGLVELEVWAVGLAVAVRSVGVARGRGRMLVSSREFAKQCFCDDECWARDDAREHDVYEAGPLQRVLVQFLDLSESHAVDFAQFFVDRLDCWPSAYNIQSEQAVLLQTVVRDYDDFDPGLKRVARHAAPCCTYDLHRSVFGT